MANVRGVVRKSVLDGELSMVFRKQGIVIVQDSKELMVFDAG